MLGGSGRMSSFHFGLSRGARGVWNFATLNLRHVSCRSAWSIGTAALLLWAATESAALGGELRVGVAEVSITPPPGIPMAGYYSERGAQGVHDDLHAKAIVIEAGGARRPWSCST